MIEAGKTLKDISDSLNLSISRASILVSGIFGESYETIRRKVIIRSLDFCLTDKLPIHRVREKFNLSPNSFYQKFFPSHSILFEREPIPNLDKIEIEKLREKLRKHNMSEINTLIDEGAISYNEIARNTKNSKQFVRYYILGSGQFSYWEKIKTSKLII